MIAGFEHTILQAKRGMMACSMHMADVMGQRMDVSLSKLMVSHILSQCPVIEFLFCQAQEEVSQFFVESWCLEPLGCLVVGPSCIVVTVILPFSGRRYAVVLFPQPETDEARMNSRCVIGHIAVGKTCHIVVAWSQHVWSSGFGGIG